MTLRHVSGSAVVLVLTTLFATPLWAQSHNALSAQERAEGWQLLFDGHSLKGWHGYNQKGTGKDWSVVDGAIRLERGHDGDLKDFQDLITDASYANYDLKLEWKMSPCADSGVLFDVHETPADTYSFQSGVEMQIADLACTVPDSRVLYERSGDMFDLYAAPYESVREAGQWNQIEVRVDHGHVQFVQNGRTTVDTTLWDDAWHARVAQTKFAHWPNFARFHQGHIALQGTENKGLSGQPIHLWFRDIRIKPLQKRLPSWLAGVCGTVVGVMDGARDACHKRRPGQSSLVPRAAQLGKTASLSGAAQHTPHAF